jgi:uncharacterized protein YndB with AHSA1/START domain
MKVHFDRTYNHPMEAVWAALTDARAIRQWWVDTDFRAEPGHEFFFRDKPQGKWDGVVRGRVLEAEPGRRVRFTWDGGGHQTVVEFRLEPAEGGGTRLLLSHDGFRGLSGLFLATMLRFGWGKYVNTILPETAKHLADKGFGVPFDRPSKAATVGIAASA